MVHVKFDKKKKFSQHFTSDDVTLVAFETLPLEVMKSWVVCLQAKLHMASIDLYTCAFYILKFLRLATVFKRKLTNLT